MNKTGTNLKMLSANLQVELVDDLLHFHNKGNICVDKNFRNRIVPFPLSLEQLEVLQHNDFEISPFHDDAISCSVSSDLKLLRHSSAQDFGKSEIAFSKIKELLQNSFATLPRGGRPYPSGGAIYPVEIICIIFSERIKDSPASGIYHYRPTLNSLQPLRYHDSKSLYEKIYAMEKPATASPSFALLYLGVISKMLVKYRYRGYRYGLLEAGSMYQQADLVGQLLQLRNKLYSGFNDHELVKMIGLDPMNFIPLVVQSFGVASICK